MLRTYSYRKSGAVAVSEADDRAGRISLRSANCFSKLHTACHQASYFPAITLRRASRSLRCKKSRGFAEWLKWAFELFVRYAYVCSRGADSSCGHQRHLNYGSNAALSMWSWCAPQQTTRAYLNGVSGLECYREDCGTIVSFQEDL